MTLLNVKDTKKVGEFLVENIIEIHYESEEKNTPNLSEAGKIKYLQQTLNSMNSFLLSLVI